VRTGCGCGCFTIGLLAVLVGGVFWLGSGIFERLPSQHEVGSLADGRRAQQKLYEVAAGSTGSRRGGRGSTVTLSERELNAFLARHLSGDQLPLNEMGVRLIGDGVAELTGRLPLRTLDGQSLGSLLRLLPHRWAPGALWVRLRGHVRLESGAARGDRRQLWLDIEQFSLGRRRLPAAVLGTLPGVSGPRAMRWPIPDAVESLTVEPGRLTVATRP